METTRSESVISCPDDFIGNPTTLPNDKFVSNAEDEEQSISQEKSARNEDKVFLKIQESLHSQLNNSEIPPQSPGILEDVVVKTADHFTSLAYGFQPRAAYEQNKKLTDIMGITYNSRFRMFVILDAKGITTWKSDAVTTPSVERAHSYPKYEYRTIIYMLYAKKYNVYFALGKDFSLKVLNRDFDEVYRKEGNTSSVLFMIFNPVLDELITGGVDGTWIWKYERATERTWKAIKPMVNYKLTLKKVMRDVGGCWVKRVDLDVTQGHLYCCSDTDLYCYDLDGVLLFKFIAAHTMSITGCQFSPKSRYLITTSLDTHVKIWCLFSGHIRTFRGHSRAITNLVMHPDDSNMFITSSLDGSLRLWSLDTMDCIYSLVVSSEGVIWMGLTDDGVLYVSTIRTMTLWNLNYVAKFWAISRNKVTTLGVYGAKKKSTRIVSVGDDSCVRFYSRSSGKNVSSVLPPPPISPLQQVKSWCYSRQLNVVYILVNSSEIWLYTIRTDPASRVAVWKVKDIQRAANAQSQSRAAADHDTTGENPLKSQYSRRKTIVNYRATRSTNGPEVVCECLSLQILDSPVVVWTPEGFVTDDSSCHLLLGLEDGRILFMDPMVGGLKRLEFKANKDRILSMRHDTTHDCLVTWSLTKDSCLLQFWSLPQLHLLHEIHTQFDLVMYARLGGTVMTGHGSGALNLHYLEPADDPGPLKPRTLVPLVDPVPNDNSKLEHKQPIIAIDSCPNKNIYCSVSCDGAIKIWQREKVLLTEIMLDDSISTACFKSPRGDLLIGYKNHVFLIGADKICAHDVSNQDDEERSDADSGILEHPNILYDISRKEMDPVDIENYLVPFAVEFSDDFMTGKKTFSTQIGADESEEDDTVSELSWAPTEIYLSPHETPRHLSVVDLTLSPTVTENDLQWQMVKTNNLQAKLRRLSRVQNLRRSSIWGRKTVAKSSALHLSDMEADDNADEFVAPEIPRFGESPGPTPSMTPLSTPDILSPEQSDVDDVQDGDHDESAELELSKVQLSSGEPQKVVLDKKSLAKSAVDVTAKSAVDVIAPSNVDRYSRAIDLANVKLDTKSIKSIKVAQAKINGTLPKPTEGLITEPKTKQVAQRSLKKKKEPTNVRKMAPERGKKPPGDVVSSNTSQAPVKSDVTEPETADEFIEVAQQRDEPTTSSTSHMSRSNAASESEGSDGESVTMATISDLKPEARKTPVAKYQHKRSQLMFDDSSGSTQTTGSRTTNGKSDTDSILKNRSHIYELTRPSPDIVSAPPEVTRKTSEERLPTPTSRGLSTLEDKLTGSSYTTSNGDVILEGDNSATVRASQTRPGSAKPGQSDVDVEIQDGADFIDTDHDDDLADDTTLDVAFLPKSTRARLSVERPQTTPEDLLQANVRPPTALVTCRETDWESMFHKLMKQYQNSGVSLDKLYRNDGMKLGTDWADHLVERHVLMRMQKEYRVQTVAERRHVQEIRQRLRRKGLPCHRDCDRGSYTYAGYSSRANTPTLMTSQSPVRRRAQSTSSPLSGSGRTSPLSGGGWSTCSRPCLGPGRGHLDHTTDQQYEREQKAAQIPFRYKMHLQDLEQPAPTGYGSTGYLDPAGYSGRTISPITVNNSSPMCRPESAVTFRLRSSRSIPSKCRNFVLVKEPKTKTGIVATPLEQKLIPQRFPQFKSQWLPHSRQGALHQGALHRPITGAATRTHLDARKPAYLVTSLPATR